MSESRPSPPIDYLVKPVHGANAARIADLASYENDLRRADRSLILMSTTTDIERLAIYWDHAVVIYARVFASGGVRSKFEAAALLNALTPESRVCHQMVIDERNKHVAHSVNGMENSATVFALADPKAGREREFLGVGTLHLRQTPISQHPSMAFRKLVAEALFFVQADRAVLIEIVKDQLRKLSLDELYSIADLDFQINPYMTASTRRKRFGAPRA